MIPMLPLCNSQPMVMPMNPGLVGMAPTAMVPMVPIAGAPLLCPPNNINLLSTSTMSSEYDSQMYGRFRHVGRENPRYRHAPFDWYRPPKQCYNIVHEDAAVVTMDGPVPIGDFYRHYIYGDDYDDVDDDLSSLETDDYGDGDDGLSSYEQRSVGYRRDPRIEPDFDDSQSYRSAPRTGPYTTLNSSRGLNTGPMSTGNTANRFRGTRTLAGDDDFDDAASVNSTYAN